MFQNGKGLFGGSAMASGPMRKPEKERGPFDSTTGKLALLGDLLLRAGGRGGNPMVAHMQRQQMMDRQMQMAKQSREWGMQDFAEQERIKAQYATPDLPPEAKLANWYNSLPEGQRGQAISALEAVRPIFATDVFGRPHRNYRIDPSAPETIPLDQLPGAAGQQAGAPPPPTLGMRGLDPRAAIESMIANGYTQQQAVQILQENGVL